MRCPDGVVALRQLAPSWVRVTLTLVKNLGVAVVQCGSYLTNSLDISSISDCAP